MNKKYMIFISSTYDDLIKERSSVLKTILEMDHIPAGMELFQASNENQWDLIKEVIDMSDYYLVVICAKYGSIHPDDDISYTEKEYLYALECYKPILGFIHGDPGSIASKYTDPENAEKLEAFRTLVKLKPVKYWNNPSELAAAVATSLNRETNRNPQIGWIRADQQKPSDEDLLIQLNELHNDLKEKERFIEELQKKDREPNKIKISEFKEKSHFLNFELSLKVVTKKSESILSALSTLSQGASWSYDETFKKMKRTLSLLDYIAPSLIQETTNSTLSTQIQNSYKFNAKSEAEAKFKRAKHILEDDEPIDHEKLRIDKFELTMDPKEIAVIIADLHILNIIEPGLKKRQVRDKSKYWKLTNQGYEFYKKRREKK